MVKKHRGRPKLPKSQAKGETLILRLQKSEKQAIKVAASKTGQKPSEWARKALLERLNDVTNA